MISPDRKPSPSIEKKDDGFASVKKAIKVFLNSCGEKDKPKNVTEKEILEKLCEKIKNSSGTQRQGPISIDITLTTSNGRSLNINFGFSTNDKRFEKWVGTLTFNTLKQMKRGVKVLAEATPEQISDAMEEVDMPVWAVHGTSQMGLGRL